MCKYWKLNYLRGLNYLRDLNTRKNIIKYYIHTINTINGIKIKITRYFVFAFLISLSLFSQKRFRYN